MTVAVSPSPPTGENRDPSVEAGVLEEPAASVPTVRVGVLVGSWPAGLPDGSWLRALGQQVEGAGFDVLLTGDHVFGRTPTVEALSLVTAWAVTTSTLLLGTGVLLLPLREPAVLAKQMATIAYLSEGRLIAGFGVGGEIASEWAAMQVDRSNRGQRMDEYLHLVQALWRQRTVDVTGKFRTISGVSPTPICDDEYLPAVWIGGRSDAALARASKYDGWFGYAVTPKQVQSCVKTLSTYNPSSAGFRIGVAIFSVLNRPRREALEQIQRHLYLRYQKRHPLEKVAALSVTGGTQEAAERIAEYQGAGVTDFLFFPQVDAAEWSEQIESMAAVADVVRSHGP